jgi:hypothetical protein
MVKPLIVSQGPKTANERVSAYRQRNIKQGGRTIYGNIQAEANVALEAIMEKKGYSLVGAIEYALLRTAKDVNRTR